mgnify:FL=1
MFNNLLFIALAAFGWAFTVIIEKHYLLKYFKSIELVLLRAPFFIFFFLYYFIMNKKFNYKIKNVSLNIFLLLSFTMVTGCIALFCFYKLLNNKDSFYCVSIVQPLFIVLTILISYFYYEEDINIYQALGIVLVVCGILIVNLNTKK